MRSCHKSVHACPQDALHIFTLLSSLGRESDYEREREREESVERALVSLGERQSNP